MRVPRKLKMKLRPEDSDTVQRSRASEKAKRARDKHYDVNHEFLQLKKFSWEKDTECNPHMQ